MPCIEPETSITITATPGFFTSSQLFWIARAASPESWPWRTFGYGWEFDREGRLDDLRISFTSLATLLLEIDRQAREILDQRVWSRKCFR